MMNDRKHVEVHGAFPFLPSYRTTIGVSYRESVPGAVNGIFNWDYTVRVCHVTIGMRLVWEDLQCR
jgi:hypothetical protein